MPSPFMTVTTVSGLTASALAGVGFSNTIGLGSIIVAALIVIVAGLFTLRNNLKSFWKTLAEERGEQVKVLEAKLAVKAQELVDAQQRHTDQMAAFAEEQREVRHVLKTENAALTAQLKLEVAKHDLSTVIVRLDEMEATLDGRSAMFENLASAITAQTELLTQIRDRMVRP